MYMYKDICPENPYPMFINYAYVRTKFLKLEVTYAQALFSYTWVKQYTCDVVHVRRDAPCMTQ